MLVTFVFTLCFLPASAQEPVANRVQAEISQDISFHAQTDSVTNTPLNWDQFWQLNIINMPDETGLPVVRPQVVVASPLHFVRFRPDDPAIFQAQPDLGTYSWTFNDLVIKESQHLPLSLWETVEPIAAQPRFSASREVTPLTLNDSETLQEIVVWFTLEEALPLEVNNLAIIIGNINVAYDQYKLVESGFVSQDPVTGWRSETDGVRAYWVVDDPRQVEVGKTYLFRTTLSALKSPLLLGAPISKPNVQIAYMRWRFPQPILSNSIELVFSDLMRATYFVEGEVKWLPGMSDFRRNFHFDQVVSQLTPPPPPFRVVIPADVRIEPETLSMKSEGVVTAFVQLPIEYSVQNIDIRTVRCRGAFATRGTIADNALIVKFNRDDLVGLRPGENIEFTVRGYLNDGSVFTGRDFVRVIE